MKQKVKDYLKNIDQFEIMCTNLNHVMNNSYISVNLKKNPFSKNINKFSNKQIQYVLNQYSYFPANIVDFLKISRNLAINTNATLVAQELQRNIKEEEGSDSINSHYEILIEGIKEEFNIELSEEMNKATIKFINNIKNLLNNNNYNYVFGATYAIESSAVPELEIIEKIINKLSNNLKKTDIEQGLLKYFLDLHIRKWEPSHEAGLRNTCSKYINSNNYIDFESGFREVIKIMDIWWKEMYIETKNYY